MVKVRDLVRKDFSEFNDKFYHFEYPTLEMFMVAIKGAFNNYSVLKFLFFDQRLHFCDVL